jgi:membrane protein YdbS with pleckstrin-like domain
MAIQDHLQPGEEILYQAHITLLSLFPLTAALIVVVGAGIALYLATQAAAATFVTLAVALVIGAVLGWKYLNLRANQFIVTNHRVIRQTGLLAISSMDSRLDKINNVDHRQTLWGRVLHYGDVEIDTASDVGKAVFRNISHPLDFKHAIVTAAESYRGGFRPEAPAPAQIVQGPSGAERLRQLKALHDDGLISDEEYESKRRELLAQL